MSVEEGFAAGGDGTKRSEVAKLKVLRVVMGAVSVWPGV